MMVIQEDTKITFKENKVYEFKMLWSDQMLKTEMITQNGGSILLNSPVAGYEDLGKNTAPTNLLIIEWQNKKSAKSFKKMKLLKPNKEEAFYTHFSFPEQQ